MMERNGLLICQSFAQNFGSIENVFIFNMLIQNFLNDLQNFAEHFFASISAVLFMILKWKVTIFRLKLMMSSLNNLGLFVCFKYYMVCIAFVILKQNKMYC